MFFASQLRYIFWLSIWLHRRASGSLLYPASTVFQITSSLSLPITDLPPTHKAFFDWGFQMNYNMPFNLSSFYMVPIWPSRDRGMSKRELWSVDFTPIQLYQGIERILERHAYHRVCWKRSICELAKHPFHDSGSNWLTNLITFVLSPSLIPLPLSEDPDLAHEYHLAEWRGLAGSQCHRLYPECRASFLNVLSSLT